MATLPPPLPLDESRALARRVLDPVLKEATAKGDDAAKLWLLRVLRWLDPPAILEQIEKIKFERGTTADYLKGEAALGIVAIDAEEAVAVAETIAEPAYKAGTLVDLADALPARNGRASWNGSTRPPPQARAAKLSSNKFFQMGEVAEHWLELGERPKAMALFAEGRKLVETLPPLKRTDAGGLLTHLAWIDPKAPVDLLQGVGPDRWHERILANIAIRAGVRASGRGRAGPQPHPRAHMACRMRPRGSAAGWPGTILTAPGESPRACRGLQSAPIAWTFLADRLARDRSRRGPRRARHRRSRRSMDDPDRAIACEAPGLEPAASILPLVERIAPDRVSEVFWRAVAQQAPADDPRDDLGGNAAEVVVDQALLLSRYDRDVASVLFEPVAAYIRALPLRAGNDLSPVDRSWPWRALDPRGAVELVEGLPKARSLSINDPTNWARQTLADHLAKPPDRRWMGIWRFYSGCGIAMFEEVYRDL